MMRPLNVAVQMDPPASLHPDADSTFVLIEEAQKRGYQVWYYDVKSLALRCTSDGNRLSARARRIAVGHPPDEIWRIGEQEVLDLATMDVVLMRQDPPFDMAYITATHLLEHIQPRTLVVNDPRAVRDAPEKLLVTYFADLMPPTLITADVAAMRVFRAEQGEIIVKPLYGNGGAGVFRLGPKDENFNSVIETHFAHSREPLMLQRYEPAVRLGDKRIILVDGEPLGAVNRVPAVGEARANMHVGAVPVQSRLTARDREISARICPILRERGLIFTGIDVIGDWLTEINVTSPTGLQEITHFDSVHLEAAIWDRIETRLSAGGFVSAKALLRGAPES